MTTTTPTTPRRATNHGPRMEELSDRLTTKVQHAAVQLMQRGGAATADSIAVATGLPVTRVERIIERASARAVQQPVAPTAAAPQAPVVAEILGYLPALREATKAIEKSAAQAVRFRDGLDFGPVSVKPWKFFAGASVAGTAVAACLGGPWAAYVTFMAGLVTTAASGIGPMKTFIPRFVRDAAADTCVVTTEALAPALAIGSNARDPQVRTAMANVMRVALQSAHYYNAHEFTPVASGMIEQLRHDSGELSPGARIASGVMLTALGHASSGTTASITSAFADIKSLADRRETARAAFERLFHGDTPRQPIANASLIATILLHQYNAP